MLGPVRVVRLGTHLVFLTLARGSRFLAANRYAQQNQNRREHHLPLRCLPGSLQILVHFELGLQMANRGIRLLDTNIEWIPTDRSLRRLPLLVLRVNEGEQTCCRASNLKTSITK